MRPTAGLLALLCAVAVGACGGRASSAEEFRGERRAVAETIEDVQRAAERDEPERVCRDFVSAAFADRLERGAGSCTRELDRAFGDVGASELDVESVDVRGTSATVRVRANVDRGQDVYEVELRRTGDPVRWRIDGLRPAA